MNYSDVCLMLRPHSEEKDKYANIRYVFDMDSLNQAFCHIKDIGREEFYLAQDGKYRPSKVITMKANQYTDPLYIIMGNSMDMRENVKDFVEGKVELYKVIRTYIPGSNILARDRKNYKNSYTPTKDDIEIVVEVLKGNPLSDIKEQLKKLFGDEE